ncbi:MAG: GerMN domain-containing protein [Treponema sp.]|nr:GerMN domain-containing protein [Treponema sp.]
MFFLGVYAFVDFRLSGRERRTFVFYTLYGGAAEVEDRMFLREPSEESNIRRFVEETLLGPVSPDLVPLFPRETRLRSLLYRDGVVYADLSESAVLVSLNGGNVFQSLVTLDTGIRRNFPFVRNVKLFIEGNQVFTIFAASR